MRELNRELATLDQAIQHLRDGLDAARRAAADGARRRDELEAKVDSYRVLQDRRVQRLETVRNPKEASTLMAELDLARSVMAKEENDWVRSAEAVTALERKVGEEQTQGGGRGARRRRPSAPAGRAPPGARGRARGRRSASARRAPSRSTSRCAPGTTGSGARARAMSSSRSSAALAVPATRRSRSTAGARSGAAPSSTAARDAARSCTRPRGRGRHDRAPPSASVPMVSVFPAPVLRWVMIPPPDPAAVRRLAAELRIPTALAALLVQRGQGSETAARALPAARRHRALRSRRHRRHGGRRSTPSPPRCARAAPSWSTATTTWTASAPRPCSRARSGRPAPTSSASCRTGSATATISGPPGSPWPSGSARRSSSPATAASPRSRRCAAARAAGIGVVVTDHHLPGAELPPALAIVDPQRSDDTSDARALCGTGIAFKLVQALVPALGLPPNLPYHLLDLVALATVADVVPLVGENRILVRHGLRLLAESRWPGLRALVEAQRSRRPGDAGRPHGLRPRPPPQRRRPDRRRGRRPPPAAHRRRGEAAELARRLEGLNVERQSLDHRILEEALAQVEQAGDPERDAGFVLAGDGWHTQSNGPGKPPCLLTTSFTV